MSPRPSLPQRFVQEFSQGVSSGATQQVLDSVPAPLRHRAETLAHSAFIGGLNAILVVAAVVLFAGAVLAFVLVRQQDFVASGAGARARARRSRARGRRKRSASCQEAMRSITAAPVTMTSA